MIALSYSGMQDYQCPWRFKVLKIDKSYKEPESEALRVGAAVATILAGYRSHCYEEGLSSDLSYFDGVEIPLDPDIKDRVRELLENFASTEFATIPLNAEWVHVESQPVNKAEKIGGFAYNPSLYFLGHDKSAWLHKECAFRLKCDFLYYLDGTLYVVDDKSGFGDGDETQLSFYAFLAKLAWMDKGPGKDGKPLNKIVCSFNNIATRKTTTIEFSPQDTNPVREVIRTAIFDVNARKEWPAVACSKCGFCTVPGCPIREETSKALVAADASPVASIPTEIQWVQDAEKTLLFVQFAKAITDRVKELLEAWVEKNGPVMAGGKVARFQDEESWKPKDLAALCAALVSFGAPKELVWKELSLTRAALEKIVKKAKLEAKQPWIDAYIEKKSSKAFGIVKDKDLS